MRIYDGREFFYQWDTGQKIVSSKFKAGEEVHVGCSCHSAALPVIAYELGGLIVADVPDGMLQRAGNLNAYLMRTDSAGRATKEEFSFVIKPRKKPSDYVYTETEVASYRALEQRISKLEESEQPNAQLALLIETDMLPAVYNADGKILTDSSGRIILRY